MDVQINDSDEADNEQSMFYKKKDLSMSNVGRRSKRQSQTTAKKREKLKEEDFHSAGEMDESEKNISVE